MFIRSFRLFNVRFSLRVAAVTTHRYSFIYSLLSEDCDHEYDTMISSNSRKAMLKELPDVARCICLKEAQDIRIVLKDMDFDGEEIFSEIYMHQPLRILEVPKAIGCGIVKLK